MKNSTKILLKFDPILKIWTVSNEAGLLEYKIVKKV